jgi:CRISPR system Cascade subunit CasB
MTVRTDRLDDLVHYLEELAARQENGDSDARAALARLRRSLGRWPTDSLDVARYVAHYLPADPRTARDRARESAAYLIAGLFAYHPVSWQSEDPKARTSFGASFRQLTEGKTEDQRQAIDRRFEVLLACHDEELPFHLRRAIALLKSADVPVDWRRLVRHVAAWNHPDRYVQLAWARHYWA